MRFGTLHRPLAIMLLVLARLRSRDSLSKRASSLAFAPATAASSASATRATASA